MFLHEIDPDIINAFLSTNHAK